MASELAFIYFGAYYGQTYENTVVLFPPALAILLSAL